MDSKWLLMKRLYSSRPTAPPSLWKTEWRRIKPQSWLPVSRRRFELSFLPSKHLEQWFSTFVRPRPGNLFFYKTRARDRAAARRLRNTDLERYSHTILLRVGLSCFTLLPLQIYPKENYPVPPRSLQTFQRRCDLITCHQFFLFKTVTIHMLEGFLSMHL
jgi:hypothetical protein